MRGTLKLTWQVTPRNKIQSFTLINRESWGNNRGGLGRRPAEAQSMQDWQDYFTGVTWESLLDRQPVLQVADGRPALLPHVPARDLPDTSRTPAWTMLPKRAAVPAARTSSATTTAGTSCMDQQLEVVNTLE